MSKHILILILIACIFFGCENQTKTSEQATEIRTDKKILLIPIELKYYIQKELPELILPSEDMYIENWEEFITDSMPPYFCTSDFNGDGIIDYSLLLLNKKNDLLLYSFLKSNNDYKPILIDSFIIYDYGIEAILSVVEKGLWEAAPDVIKSVPFDGIRVEFIENSLSWSYYYQDGTFIRFLYD